MRRAIFTPEIQAQIPLWVAQNKRADEIAGLIGCNASTLKVRCSQLKISLRTPNWKQRKPRLRQASDLPKVYLEDKQPRPLVQEKRRRLVMQSSLQLSRVATSRLSQQADALGMTTAQLASMLLEAIAQDDLYGAVLDQKQEAA